MPPCGPMRSISSSGEASRAHRHRPSDPAWSFPTNKYQIGRHGFLESISDSQRKRAALRDDRSFFLADKSYVRVGDAPQHFPRSDRIKRRNTRIKKDLQFEESWSADTLSRVLLSGPPSTRV